MKSIRQDDIVVYALHGLGGATKKVLTEHVAAEAYRLAPDVFGWELPEYREKGWPDKAKVRKALFRLRGDDVGRLVEGYYFKETSKDGWRLTSAGVEWVQENEQRILSTLAIPSTKMPKKQTKRFLDQLRRDPLFHLYQEDRLDTATRYQFTDMLNCSPDAAPEVLVSKFERLRAMAADTRDKSVIEFLNACHDRFGESF